MHLERVSKTKRIFQDAVEVPPAKRAEFVAEACAGDADMRRAVEDLLAAHEESLQVHTQADSVEQPGEKIGRFQLIREIGRGGFGTVWLAEQQVPVHRKVALKILKMGMDTRQVVARFEAERQALALMDHPGIAKVHDGGETANGRPYFVMEFVDGKPITQYCDDAGLCVADRLELFAAVCDAVQHAHLKGVIHRDLKPSNVLITLLDGRPVAKVIDFGIAKATEGHLTEKTVITEFRQLLGTPEYMAPEQAGSSGLDVDTRADVYGLGVLLYELLTGRRPFEAAEVPEAGFLELLRRIREDEPKKPSTRVTTLRDGELLEISKRRHVHPRTLGRLMRGELDWVVMKALEKERGRRYVTATALAEDVRRYLNHEPVLAGPPSRLYRLRKYVRRHRIGVAASLAVVLSLAVGAVAAGWSYVEAKAQAAAAVLASGNAQVQARLASEARDEERKQRGAAEAQAKEALAQTKKANTVIALLQGMLKSSNPHEVKGRDYTVRQLLEDFDRGLGSQLDPEPEVEVAVRRTIGDCYLGLGLPQKARDQLDRARMLSRRVLGEDSLPAREHEFAWAQYLHDTGDNEAAIAVCRQLLPKHERDLENESSQAARVLVLLSDCLVHLDRAEEATPHAERAIDLRRRAHGDLAIEVAQAETNLAGVWQYRGDFQRAEVHQREALRLFTALQPGDHPASIQALGRLGSILQQAGRLNEAQAAHREALEMARRVFGNEHHSVANALHGLGLVHLEGGDFAKAEPLLREGLEQLQAMLGQENRSVADAKENLARLYMLTGRLANALPLQQEALATTRRLVQTGGGRALQARINNLAVLLLRSGDGAAAEPLLREGLDLLAGLSGDQRRARATAFDNLGQALMAQGRLDEAEKLLRDALSLRREFYGEDHLGIVVSLSNVAGVCVDRGRLDEAITLYVESVDMARRLQGPASIELATSLNQLGIAQERKGDLMAAKATHEAALAMRRKLLGPRHPDIATSLSNLGQVLRKRGDLDAAEAVFQESVTMNRALFSKDHPHIAINLTSLGLVLRDRKDHVGSIAFFRESIEVQKRLRGDNHPSLAGAWTWFARALRDSGEPIGAVPPFREALRLRKTHQPQGHRDIAMLANELAGVLRGLGQAEEADRLSSQFPTPPATSRPASR